MAGTVQLDTRNGEPVAVLTVDRPATLNAIDAEVLEVVEVSEQLIEGPGHGRALGVGGDEEHFRIPERRQETRGGSQRP